MDIANRFNDFFLQSIEEIVSDEEKTINAKKQIEIERGIQINQFKEVTYKEVDKIIRNLENKKGTDEGITTNVLKMRQYREDCNSNKQVYTGGNLSRQLENVNNNSHTKG